MKDWNFKDWDLNRLRLSLPLALAVIAAAQTAVLAWMVIDRTRLIRSGQEIVLPIRPVDPRDLFRGQYVRLGYDMSSMPLRLLEGPRPSANAAFYVTIEPQPDGSWRPVKITSALPSALPAGQIALKARPIYRFPAPDRGPNASVGARYGIESYFVPEGEGPRLEALARDKKLAVLVAVDRSGNAALKGIMIDGQLQYSEPLL